MFISEQDFIKLKAPKISWDSQEFLIRVYCDVGEDYSQFCFKFDYEKFIYLYNQCKGRFKLVDGNGYYDKAGDYHMSYYDFARKLLGNDEFVIRLFSLVLKFYQLNPSVCHRVVFKKFKGKGHTRRLELVPKKKEFDKVILGKNNMGGSRTKGVGKKTKIKEPNVELMTKLSGMMNDVILESSKTHSLQLFDEYKMLYVQWEIASGLRTGLGSYLSRSKEKALFVKYKSLVKNLQK